jgi:hypothetical protein
MSEARQEPTPGAPSSRDLGLDRRGGLPARHYVGWLKGPAGTWQQVVDAEDAAACYRQLLAHVRHLPTKPPATAVLPAGAHPEDRSHSAAVLLRQPAEPTEGEGGRP